MLVFIVRGLLKIWNTHVAVLCFGLFSLESFYTLPPELQLSARLTPAQILSFVSRVQQQIDPYSYYYIQLINIITLICMIFLYFSHWTAKMFFPFWDAVSRLERCGY